MSKRGVKITSSAYYLPKTQYKSSDLDRKLGLKEGTLGDLSRIHNHYYADKNNGESQVEMAGYALNNALEKQGLKFEDLDAVICTSGTSQQEIPSTAALILNSLGKKSCKITAFDINSTCLSFVTGLDTISYMVEAGRYKRVALISTEIATAALDYEHLESAALFSDGAACIIIEKTPEGEESEILSGHMELYPEGAETCRLQMGGSAYHPKDYPYEENKKMYAFEMNGPAVFRLASKTAKGFMDRFLDMSKMTMENIDMVVPHQASASGMAIVQRKLKLTDDKWMNIVADHGNMISASIPLAFAKGVESGKIKRGQNVMLFGTGAGFAIGGLILKY